VIVSSFSRRLILALRYRGLEPNEAIVAEYLKGFEGKLNAFDVILGKQKFLAGDVRRPPPFISNITNIFLNKKITLADLYTLPHGTLLKDAKVDILEDPKRPNVARWWKEISERPSWQAVKDGNFGK
jgi:glutathione S-transferase